MSPIIAFLALNPDFSCPTATEWFSGHQTRPFLFIAAFVDFLSFFYLNYCVCYKYITALLRLHTIFVLHGGARRPRGRLAPFIRGPSCPIHTSADFFTFTHNPLISLPFSMKVIENVYNGKCISTSHWLTITR